MRLGGSLRRNRKPRGRSQEDSGVTWTRHGSGGSGGGAGRLALQVLGLIALGWSIGYLVSTRILYPAPAPPTDLVHVPDVRGVDLATARERLTGEGLVLGEVDSLRYPTVAAGLILGQSPLSGQLARPGAEVQVTESLGPQRRSVPDLARVDAQRARTVLETSGFLVAMDSVESEIPRGRVVETVPGPDQEVALPAEIQMMVSKGPPLVPMPLLLGLKEEDAVSTLDSLGLVVGEVEEVFRFGRDQGIVVEQQPPADSLLERGSAVHLSVGRRGG